MSEVEEPDRRDFLSIASSIAMAGGLAAGYGTLAVMAGRFLYLNQTRRTAWLYVGEAARFGVNESRPFQTPAGQQVTITRRKEEGRDDDFLALSTVCPHLGCRVHWESANRRFFCPCHNGAFDAEGRATEGPPKDADQTLPQFPLRVVDGLIFIEAPVDLL